MEKVNKLMLIIATISFIVGIFFGIGGMYYHSTIYPQKQAYAESQKEQERLNNMAYEGKVLLVNKNDFTIKINKKAGEIVKDEIEKINVNDQTTFQNGMKFLNKDNTETIDLTKILKPGMIVNVLNNNGTALVVHFDQ